MFFHVLLYSGLNDALEQFAHTRCERNGSEILQLELLPGLWNKAHYGMLETPW